MGVLNRILVITTLSSFLLCVGFLLFTKGFLLKRVEIHKDNSCESFQIDPASFLQASKTTQNCWLPKHYARAIVIVIDALRYDFITSSDGSNAYYLNKLTAITDLVKSETNHSISFRFLADPPTTTLQRLKGLTSGSLPTFVDAGSNFAGSEIREDNIITQLIKHNKKVIFMGDDTWMGLFPRHFYKSFPFPSLNVKDLDTVDSGIIAKLVPEINNNDFDVIIAHFLGVDHCGHTFGPDHPKMSEKLKEMDSVIRSVIEAMPEDCVMVLLGDHGMTRTGDHGGDSPNELDAALFMYSRSRLTNSKPLSGDGTVRQIDLVPTLSLLLGLPIPFSNLGMVIPELFAKSQDTLEQLCELVDALRVNSYQVREYLDSYIKVSGEFPAKKLADLEATFQLSENLVSNLNKSQGTVSYQTLVKAKNGYIAYLQGARAMCEELWAKFDLTTMFLGFFVAFTSIITSTATVYICRMTYEQKLEILPSVLNIGIVVTAVVLLLSEASFITCLIYFGLSLAVTGIVLFKLLRPSKNSQSRFVNRPVRALPIVMMAVFFVCISGSFSNSYVVYEDTVTAFLVQAVVVLQLCIINTKLRNSEDLKLNLASGGIEPVQRKTKASSRDIGRIITSPRFLGFLLTLLFCLIIRLTVHTRLCREEQLTCEPPPLLRPLAAITDDQRTYKSAKYFFSITVVAVIPLGFKYWMQFMGNWSGDTAMVLFVRNLLPVCYVCIAMYWAVLTIPQTFILPTWSQVIFPQIIYISVLLLVVALVFKPLAVHVIYRSSEQASTLFPRTPDRTVPKMYEHLKLNWRKYMTSENRTSEGRERSNHLEDKKTPIVYGLASVYSAAVLTLLAGVSMVSVLVLGDGPSISIPLYLLAMWCFLELHASLVNLNLDEIERRHLVPWSSVVGWCLLVSHFFYATGHQPTVPSIRFEAAYVGFVGDHTIYAIPSFLILLNTFCSHVLGVIALPLLLFWPQCRGVPIYAFTKSEAKEEDQTKGEFIFHDKNTLLRSGLFQLAMSYLILCAVKVFSTMAAAGLHRRHLMVWKIFAPHFIFEGVAFLVTCATMLLVIIFVLRVNSALSKWTKKL